MITLSFNNKKKWFLRILFYLAFLPSTLEISKETIYDVEIGILGKVILILLLLTIIIIATEIIVWLIYKLFLKINFYGLKKPRRYKKDIKRFTIILFILWISSLIIFTLVNYFYTLPQLLINNLPWWVIYPTETLYLISLVGLYKFRKWGLKFFILVNVIYAISHPINDLTATSIISAIMAYLPFVYYAYIRRNVLK